MTAIVPPQPAKAATRYAQWMQQAGRGNMQVSALFSAAAALQAAQPQQAVALYRHWLEHSRRSPQAYAAWFNLAVLLAGLGADSEAETAYRRSISLRPRLVEAHFNLGILLERMGRPEEAVAQWRRILGPAVGIDARSQPSLYLQTLNALGRLLEIQQQLAEAEQMLALSLSSAPDQPQVMTHWVHLRQKQCKWPTYSGLEHISRRQMEQGASALAMLSLTDDPALQLEAARRFVHEKIDSGVAALSNGDGYGHSRLRIGYLSSDFCAHAVSILTAELYELHDRSQFEVYAFSWSRDDGSPLRERVVRAMDHYLRIDELSDAAAAQYIRQHEIDILIDLHGLTAGARPQILAYRPAPVQITWLGFPGTSALPGIDYVIADSYLMPPHMAQHFTEQPLYLPDTFQINDRQRRIGPRPSRASVGLPETGLVFCSFNNSYKLKPELFAHWMNILQRVPASVLWLVADTPAVAQRLQDYAAAAGVARERLIFASRAAPADYLARYQLADLFLDTYPFNAGTTASDALWAGLPLLTCSGPTFASRMAGSLLHAVGLPELITESFNAYEELAVALAHAPERLAQLRLKLAAQRQHCALFDSPRFVRNLEAQLRRIARPARATPACVTPPAAIMNIDQIPIITVSYNAPDLIATLLASLRQHYPHNPVYVIDGSSTAVAEQIRPIVEHYPATRFIAFGYNIHHGPGMAWAIDNLDLSGPVLFLDSDVEILKRGFLESLMEQLQPDMYGVGNVTPVDPQGQPNGPDAIPYLHPACMLTNIEVVRRWPLPVKHGAPMLPPMLALARAGQSQLLRNIEWVNNDFSDQPAQRIFIRHDWQGTVRRTGGYHYDKPASSRPINTALLTLAPKDAIKVVEVGCGDGTFAKAYKQHNPVCNYIGVESDVIAAEQARAHCDFVYAAPIDSADPQRDKQTAQANCWILDGTLERVTAPWDLLKSIRASIAVNGVLVLSVSNFQHWSVQLRLSVGDLRYQADGTMERTALRQFTRGSVLALLTEAGFQISGGMPIVFDEPGRERFLPLIGQLAAAAGGDARQAIEDALPRSYIIMAKPA